MAEGDQYLQCDINELSSDAIWRLLIREDVNGNPCLNVCPPCGCDEGAGALKDYESVMVIDDNGNGQLLEQRTKLDQLGTTFEAPTYHDAGGAVVVPTLPVIFAGLAAPAGAHTLVAGVNLIGTGPTTVAAGGYSVRFYNDGDPGAATGPPTVNGIPLGLGGERTYTSDQIKTMPAIAFDDKGNDLYVEVLLP